MLTTDELVTATRRELDELFLDGETPEDDALEGDTRGALLAGRGPLGIAPLRELVNTPLSPWRGKRVEGATGANRFGYGGVGSEGFGFEMYLAPSLLPEDNDALVFDYDTSGNPPGIRRVRDDLKEVREGLFLGRSTVFVDGDYRFVTYFALEKTDTDASPPGTDDAVVIDVG